MSFLRELVRSGYYMVNNGRVTNIDGYDHLKRSKWIINGRFGMAYYKGYYEPEICSYLLQNIKTDSVFVDVGAHAGYFSLFAVQLARNGAVYSFEPEPENCRYIREIKRVNEINNWFVFNQGVGKEEGQLYFSNGPSSTTGKISETGDFKVDIVSLDEALFAVEKVDVIKIDVEGFGGRVLEGAMQVIRKHLPKIMFEVHKNSDELAVLHQLLGDNYSLKDLATGQEISTLDCPHFIVAEPKQL
jgi:FkbM family methyltransferase